MGKKIVFEFFLLVLSFGLLWLGLSQLPFFSKKISDDIAIEKEEQLGELLLKTFLYNHQEIHNSSLDSSIHIIHSRLLSTLDSSEYEYQIRVIDNEEINAFALPGGNIVVFSGLIQFSDSPEEVAAVLAHEIGHIENKHIIGKLIKELGVGILVAVIGGKESTVLKEIGMTALSTVFDRKQESEADDFAMNLLVKSNINPRVIATFFRRLSREKGEFNKNLELLMTHPHNSSRIKSALEFSLPKDFEEKKLEVQNWEELKNSLHSSLKKKDN